MPKTTGPSLVRLAEIIMLAVGIAMVVLSFFVSSSFLVILGVALIFWGLILFYITPTKQVPLTLLTSSACNNASNIERIIIELDLTRKGIYLPSQSLKDLQSATIFVPKGDVELPTSEDINQKLINNQKNGIFLTPQGLALTQQFEKELGVSFSKTHLGYVQKVFPNLMVEKMELAQEAEMQIQGDLVTVMVKGSVLDDVCQESQKQPRTHELIGCLLSSGLACMLARASGKAVIIKDETHNPSLGTTVIEFQLYKV